MPAPKGWINQQWQIQRRERVVSWEEREAVFLDCVRIAIQGMLSEYDRDKRPARVATVTRAMALARAHVPSQDGCAPTTTRRSPTWRWSSSSGKSTTEGGRLGCPIPDVLD
jgi:hypothetical protein